MAKGDTAEQDGDVGFLDHLQELVGGVALQAAHGRCRVINSNASVVKKTDNVVFQERLVGSVYQPGRIVKEYHAEDFPHHVGAVGIKEIHTPPCTGRRETAQHQQPCLRR